MTSLIPILLLATAVTQPQCLSPQEFMGFTFAEREEFGYTVIGANQTHTAVISSREVVGHPDANSFTVDGYLCVKDGEGRLQLAKGVSFELVPFFLDKAGPPPTDLNLLRSMEQPSLPISVIPSKDGVRFVSFSVPLRPIFGKEIGYYFDFTWSSLAEDSSAIYVYIKNDADAPSRPLLAKASDF